MKRFHLALLLVVLVKCKHSQANVSKRLKKAPAKNEPEYPDVINSLPDTHSHHSNDQPIDVPSLSPFSQDESPFSPGIADADSAIKDSASSVTSKDPTDAQQLSSNPSSDSPPDPSSCVVTEPSLDTSDSRQLEGSLTSESPSLAPTKSPSLAPTETPTSSKVPTGNPTTSQVPTEAPSSSHVPTDNPSTSKTPTDNPSLSKNPSDSYVPTEIPSSSHVPTDNPSSIPTDDPSHVPTTSISPSDTPSYTPTDIPSTDPSASPSVIPSTSPSGEPSDIPSNSPSDKPSNTPSNSPSDKPSDTPTDDPSHVPTTSISPSDTPSYTPTDIPSTDPSASPSVIPSTSPSGEPSDIPSSSPSHKPSTLPSDDPSTSPSLDPSPSPSVNPSDIPSFSPSHKPSTLPSDDPSTSPSVDPSPSPSANPSDIPSFSPSHKPSTLPSDHPSTSPSVDPSPFPSPNPTGDCPIKIFRDDEPDHFTHELTDWPAIPTCPRSPKYVFGEKRPITIEVGLDLDQDTITVKVTNKENDAVVEILCDYNAGTFSYRSRIPDEILYLHDATIADENKIHVVEEAVLEFVVTDPPGHEDCKIDVMVDRGEYAVTTAPASDIFEVIFFGLAANIFSVGAAAFGKDTTPWYNAGFETGNPNFSTFLLNVGDNSAKNKQADILVIIGHGNEEGEIGTRSDDITFVPDSNAPGVDSFGNQVEWNSDIDWALLLTCYSLNNEGIATAAMRWRNAFNGEPRGLHGLLGYSSGCKIIISPLVIFLWVVSIGGGTPIPDAWMNAARIDSRTPAFWVIERNKADTIHEMKRDPCEGDVPVYESSGMTGRIKKKKGFKRGGKKPLIDGEVKPQGVSSIDSKLPKPLHKIKILNKKCRVYDEYTKVKGKYATKLWIKRTENPTQNSPFIKENDGEFVFRSGQSYLTFAPNSVSNQEVDDSVRLSLQDGFKKVPKLHTHGVFAGQATTTSSQSFASGFEVVLDQQYKSLPIYDSDIYAQVSHEGNVTYISAVFYRVKTKHKSSKRKKPKKLIDARQAAVAAGRAFLKNAEKKNNGKKMKKKKTKCDITLIYPYYGMPVVMSGGNVKRVRPVWAVEFGQGLSVYTVDAITGKVLKVAEGEQDNDI